MNKVVETKIKSKTNSKDHICKKCTNHKILNIASKTAIHKAREVTKKVKVNIQINHQVDTRTDSFKSESGSGLIPSLKVLVPVREVDIRRPYQVPR